MAWPMLEREFELAEVSAAAAEAAGGTGSIVLICGEAGIGKSRIIDALPSIVPGRSRLLIGYCDDLAVPRVLGPFRDIGPDLSSSFMAALQGEDRTRTIDCLRAALSTSLHPTVLVIEDAHWADEATCDVLSYLGRRIGQLPVLLILTYRNDHLTSDHPLHTVLGQILPSTRHRLLQPSPLSLEAVRRLGGSSSLDPDQVYGVTLGNPLLVTEALASGDVDSVPRTIAAIARSRLRTLPGVTREALERLSVIPSGAESWLATSLLDGGLASLATAQRLGLLTVSPRRIAFRHELMRRAVLDSLDSLQRITYNQVVLSALLDSQRDVDLSRIVHHAAEAGADEVIVEYGPKAAIEAVAAGSHREAVTHYRIVLERCAAFTASEQASFREQFAHECNAVGLVTTALEQQELAVQLRRELHDEAKLGVSLRLLSQRQWEVGDINGAVTSATEAIEVLVAAGNDTELAHALCNSALYTLFDDTAQAIATGKRAIAIARSTRNPELLSIALHHVGVGLWYCSQSGGQALLEESLAVALQADAVACACHNYMSLAWMHIVDLQYTEANRLLHAAVELASENELDGIRQELHLYQSMVGLALGAWDSAEREAQLALTAPQTTRSFALAILAQLRARRGEECHEILAEAWAVAARVGTPVLAPVAAVTLEVGWLTQGLPSLVIDSSYDDARRLGYMPHVAELEYWMHTAGTPVIASRSEHPFSLLAEGKWRQAAKAWEAAGCPYEEALALSYSSDPKDLLAALANLDAIGAKPLARRVRHKLKDLGLDRVPRGPSSATRSNPAGLSRRQVEVAGLLADGMTNAEIAHRLVLSVRTAESHVAAVMNKLSAATRAEAAMQAKALGLAARSADE